MNKSAMNVYVGHKRKACCLGWEEQEILLFIEKGPHRRKDWREVVWEGCCSGQGSQPGREEGAGSRNEARVGGDAFSCSVLHRLQGQKGMTGLAQV